MKKLEDFASLELAERWDNVGLLIEPATPQAVKHILLTNDLTEKVNNDIFKLNNNNNFCSIVGYV